MIRLTLALLLMITPILQGCTVAGAAVGAVATAGVASFQERGFGGVMSDAQIEIAINRLWFEHDFKMFQNLNIKVYEGRVLLTGYVPEENQRFDAVRLAWQPEGVKEVINEIHIGEPLSLGQQAKDKWIGSQIESKLLFEREVYNINYNIHTVNNVVYLIGIAQDQRELEIVTSIASQTADVERVISYVRFRDEAPSS